MAGDLMELLGDSMEDTSKRRELEDFVRNLKTMEATRLRGDSALAIADASTGQTKLARDTSMSKLKMGIEKGTGTGDFKVPALMKQVLADVKGMGVSPTKNKGEWLSAMVNRMGQHPELMAQTLAMSSALDAVNKQQSDLAMERAKLGLAIKKDAREDDKLAIDQAKLMLDGAKNRREELMDAIKRQREALAIDSDAASRNKTILEIRQLQEELASGSVEAKVDSERALAEQRRASAAASRAQAAGGGSGSLPNEAKIIRTFRGAVTDNDWVQAVPLATQVAEIQQGKVDDMVLAASKAQDAAELTKEFNDIEQLIVNPTGGLRQLRENITNFMSTLTTKEEGLVNKTIGVIRSQLEPGDTQRIQDTQMRLLAVKLAKFMATASRADREGSVSVGNLKDAKRLLGVDQFLGTSTEDLLAASSQAKQYVASKQSVYTTRSATPKLTAIRNAVQQNGDTFNAIYGVDSVTGEGYYQIYVNGKKVPEGVIR